MSQRERARLSNADGDRRGELTDTPSLLSVRFNGDVAEHESGWVPFVPGGLNEHLTAEARSRAEAAYQAEQERRGAVLGRVVVDVYENAAVPHVQGTSDSDHAADLVRRARVALEGWR